LPFKIVFSITCVCLSVYICYVINSLVSEIHLKSISELILRTVRRGVRRDACSNCGLLFL